MLFGNITSEPILFDRGVTPLFCHAYVFFWTNSSLFLGCCLQLYIQLKRDDERLVNEVIIFRVMQFGS